MRAWVLKQNLYINRRKKNWVRRLERMSNSLFKYSNTCMREVLSWYDIVKTILGVSLPKYNYFTKYMFGKLKKEYNGNSNINAIFRKYSRNGRNWSAVNAYDNGQSHGGLRKGSHLYSDLRCWQIYDEIYQRYMYISEHPKSAKGSYTIMYSSGFYKIPASVLIDFRKSFDSEHLKNGSLRYRVASLEYPKDPVCVIKDKILADKIANYLRHDAWGEDKSNLFKVVSYP